VAPVGRIAVYGASGYTGRLVAAELRRRGLPFTLSGRSAERLRSVAEEVGGDPPVRPASLDDRAALRRALRGCAAVINCAGPFVRTGEPVLRAAIESGVHYLDTTGEQPWMKRVVDEHDGAARAAGVAAVCAMGFDYVPGDLIARLTAEGREPLEELVLGYAVEGFGMTRGTLRSGLEMMKGGDLIYADGDWRPAGTGPLRASFPFPEPLGRQPVARYPAGEIVTVPRHTDTQHVAVVISTASLAPHRSLARALPLAMPALSLALRTPLRPALSAAIGRLPEGPPEDERRAARFTIVALARGRDGRVARGVVRGSDVYGLTAVTTVQGASLMADPGYGRSGALAPASAFDPAAFLQFLAGHGVTYDLDPTATG
jgi:short subunit dehydrogenase-like uncharacterized protein